MFNKYIDSLSKCSKDILKNMANIDIVDVKIKQKKPLSVAYSVAHSIQYEDFENKVKGDFILGFADDSEAITIASAIAKNIGLAQIEQFDEIASDIINEFLNTVVGHTITEWDKKGLNVRFSPPVLLQKKEINISDGPNTEAYMVSLNFDPDAIILDKNANALRLMVTFTKMVEDKLLGKRILVAEDSAVMRGIILKALKNSGFEIEQASDGQEAVEKYKVFKPDLTIMDLVMPKIGGLDAIIEIQESDPDAKFVVFTSTSRRDEVVTAKSLNVLSYIVKPLKMEDLIAKVKEAFEQISE
jgi:CheY-like chemotaxis protein